MLNETEIIFRLLLATLFAGLVGLERERRTWAAGMRTHMLVGLGAALFMIVSSFGFSDIMKNPNVSLDPSRVAAQVVSGIGFLGAGTIFFLRKGVVRGLTTASGLWTVAGIGLAVGGGLYLAGLTATLISISILWLLKPLEERLFPQRRVTKIRALIPGADVFEEVMSELISATNAEHLTVKLDREETAWALSITSNNARQAAQITAVLERNESVSSVTLENWTPGS
jgi:putative Mg2+ transporter-C (MgtC) family protein